MVQGSTPGADGRPGDDVPDGPRKRLDGELADLRPLTRARRVLVMGLGRFGGGAGAARFWAELGADVTVTDRDSAEALADAVAGLADLDITYVLGGHREEDFSRADVVMVNPAVKPGDAFVARARAVGADILTEIALAWRLLRGPVLAVTGSNGKSTTTAWLGAMLRARDPATLVGGNIGGSLLPLLKSHRPSAPAVLELSSFQLHYLRDDRPCPDVAVVTNLAPNHLDWHPTVLHYYESKRVLLSHQRADQWAVLNYDDPVLREWGRYAGGRVCRTAFDDPGGPDAAFVRRGAIWCRLDDRERRLANIADLRPPGRHNVANALQAAAAALCYCAMDGQRDRAAGDAEWVGGALRSFGGLPHRLEAVGEAGGRRFVNDSKATTPDAALLALAAMEDAPLAVIAGGYDKGADLSDFGAALAARAAAVALLGATGPALRAAIEDAADDAGQPPPALHNAADIEDATRWAFEQCPPDGAVLLSPGCASWGDFTNYEERGARFAAAAHALGAR